ncbi:MAG: extracellular solute-binding protein [Spirochaetaceae bacterium]|jgi:raffinose/stachyose/melibiose transport system substrate-binding protein|nr:extracellular solute-binding protein [Spirochaetaceae bacterium]
MKITQKAIFLGLSALLALAAAGCKKGGQGSGSASDVRVLNYLDLTIANSAQEITDVWDKFSQNHPDIKVVREDLFNEPFHNKIEAYAAAGQLPDVVYAWPSGRSTTLHTQHLLKDLSPLIQKDGLDSLMVPGALDPNAQGAGYIAILPRAITSSHAFYVNNEVLRDAGLQPAKTYAELKAQVPVLRSKGYQTVLMANQDTWVMQSCLFSLIAGRFCGEGWEQRILRGEAKFTDPDFVKALEFVRTLYDDGVLSRDSLTTDYGSVVGQFATNRGAYLVDGDWRIAAFITDKSTGEGLITPERQKNFTITVFPDIEGAKLNKSTSGILGTGWGIAASIPEGSPKEAAAWELVKWLSGREIQTWLLETGGITTPTRTDIDIAALTLEPLQRAGGNLASQYRVSTAVIDGVFDAEVHVPINDGLQAIGMGTAAPGQIAAAAQQAFESWKAKQ